MKNFARLLAFVCLIAVEARADLVCLKLSSSRKISSKVTSAAQCPKGYLKAFSTDVVRGDDGILGVWGTGADGALTVTNGSTIDTSKQYTNVTIPSGVSATIRQGSILRCTGTVTVDGTLSAQRGSNGGTIGVLSPPTGSDSTAITTASASPDLLVAGSPQVVAFSSVAAEKGRAPTGVSDREIYRSLRPRLNISGGSGAGSVGTFGGAGGGSFGIYSKAGITISASGVLAANAGPAGAGAGGGAGGVIVLSSREAVTNNGSISATGSDGGNAASNSASGGGGGGGVVHFIAPTIVQGTVDVSGGAGGSAAGPGTAIDDFISGGAAGGACAGLGGSGSDLDDNGGSLAGSPGSVGQVFQTVTSSPEVELLN